MSDRHQPIDELNKGRQGQGPSSNYLGYFECFNRGGFFEAHEVLEELWLVERYGPNGDFLKGLIQLAGAFVHLQKNRLPPAASLLRLAQTNLGKYSPSHQRLNVLQVLGQITDWLERLEQRVPGASPLTPALAPKLRLD